MIDFETAKKLYEDGMTQCEVAEELETTQKVIWGLFKRNGYKCRRAIKRDQKGEKNSYWKGSDAGYAAFHRRMEAQKGRPKKCEVCGTDDKNKTYDWANLSGRYDDPNDYKRMCRSCHWKYDGKINNIKHMNKRRLKNAGEV
jgi:hypothetical protein